MKKYFIKLIILAVLFISCKENAENKNSDKVDTVVSAKSSLGNNNIFIKAKHGSIAIETARTAVIVVDIENDFGSKGGIWTEGELTFQ